MQNPFMPRRVIIDTDPGIDDAVAILLALGSAEIEVLGLLAVAGNRPLPVTARNARALAELAGRPELPVYAGCPRPIGPARIDAAYAHGDEGLGDLVLPSPARPPGCEHAVLYLVDTLRRAPPHSITLCALGPLTNIATALIIAPEIIGGIAELVIMGGGTHGNITPVAEFNIYADAMAAAVVFDSGVPITMVPLDVTEGVRSTRERIDAIRAIGTSCARAVATLLSPGPQQAGLPARPAMAMHDPCVIAWLVAPELFAGRAAHVAVETQSALILGMTVIDRPGRGGLKPNARVIESVDAAGLYRLIAERLAHLP
jgi:purine nucleosidase